MAFDQVKRKKRPELADIKKKLNLTFAPNDNNEVIFYHSYFSVLKQNIFQCQGLAKARARAGMLCRLPVKAFGKCDTVCGI